MENELIEEMKKNGLNKQQQMQKWGERQGELIKLNGGSVSDIPVDPTHEYHILDSKIKALNKLNVE
jgi:hypothetical protein